MRPINMPCSYCDASVVWYEAPEGWRAKCRTCEAVSYWPIAGDGQPVRQIVHHEGRMESWQFWRRNPETGIREVDPGPHDLERARAMSGNV